jgi:hypothetical protein
MRERTWFSQAETPGLCSSPRRTNLEDPALSNDIDAARAHKKDAAKRPLVHFAQIVLLKFRHRPIDSRREGQFR